MSFLLVNYIWKYFWERAQHKTISNRTAKTLKHGLLCYLLLEPILNWIDCTLEDWREEFALRTTILHAVWGFGSVMSSMHVLESLSSFNYSLVNVVTHHLVDNLVDCFSFNLEIVVSTLFDKAKTNVPLQSFATITTQDLSWPIATSQLVLMVPSWARPFLDS